MTDPTRWADAGDLATSLEQRLVRSGQALRMPIDERNATWQKLSSSLSPPVAPTDELAEHATAHTMLSSLPAAVKTLGVVVALAGAGVVAQHWGWLARRVERQVPPTTLDATARIALAGPDPSAAATAALSEASHGAGTLATDTPRNSTVPSTRASSGQRSELAARSLLREESLAVLAIKRALRSNDVSGALALLQKTQQQFGRGALNEEREALTIEALARSGDHSRAAQRARRFLRDYPRSPHAAAVERQVR